MKAVDWEQQRVTCPSGKVSQSWRNRQDEYGNEVVEVRFHPQDCRSCAFRSQCTRSPKSPRLLKLRPKALYQALQVARARQTSSDWKSHYGIRAGIEGTISQATRKFDLRRCRYIGLVKTQLQHTLTAAAINLTRVVAWLQQIPFVTNTTLSFGSSCP